MKHMKIQYILLVVFFCAAGAIAQTPKTISFQGVLQDQNGVAVADGTINSSLPSILLRRVELRSTPSSKPLAFRRASSTRSSDP